MSSDETLPDSFSPVKEGYIRKLPPLSKNPSHKDFRLRYLVLLDAPLRLEYYTDKTCRHRRGVITLSEGDGLRRSYHEYPVENESAFALDHLDSKRLYVFVTESDEEAFSWYMNIKSKMGGFRGLQVTRRPSLKLSRSRSLPPIPENPPHDYYTVIGRNRSLVDYNKDSESSHSVDSGLGTDSTESLLVKPECSNESDIDCLRGGMISAGSASVFVPPNSVRHRCIAHVRLYLSSLLMPQLKYDERILAPIVSFHVTGKDQLNLTGPSFLYAPNFAHWHDGPGCEWKIRVMTSESKPNEIPEDWKVHSYIRHGEASSAIAINPDTHWIALCGEAESGSLVRARLLVFGQRSVRAGTAWDVVVKVCLNCNEIARRIKMEMKREGKEVLRELLNVPVERNACVEISAFDPEQKWIARAGSFCTNPFWGNNDMENLENETYAKFKFQIRPDVDLGSVTKFSMVCEVRVGMIDSKPDQKELRAIVEVHTPRLMRLQSSQSFCDKLSSFI